MEKEEPTCICCDSCGNKIVFQALCPKCGEPFCSSDSEQGIRVALLKVKLLEDAFLELKDKIDNCKYCNKKAGTPNMRWTEQRIKEWIIENDLPVEYDIQAELKADKLKELEPYL